MYNPSPRVVALASNSHLTDDRHDRNESEYKGVWGHNRTSQGSRSATNMRTRCLVTPQVATRRSHQGLQIWAFPAPEPMA
jgi:hypothetical protein